MNIKQLVCYMRGVSPSLSGNSGLTTMVKRKGTRGQKCRDLRACITEYTTWALHPKYGFRVTESVYHRGEGRGSLQGLARVDLQTGERQERTQRN
jgi:hypothetical protein